MSSFSWSFSFIVFISSLAFFSFTSPSLLLPFRDYLRSSRSSSAYSTFGSLRKSGSLTLSTSNAIFSTFKCCRQGTDCILASLLCCSPIRLSNDYKRHKLHNEVQMLTILLDQEASTQRVDSSLARMFSLEFGRNPLE